MNHASPRRSRRLWREPALFTLLLALLLSLTALPAPAAIAQESDTPAAPTAPDWLEPRGLHVADLVGLVPEEALRGTVLNYASGTGIAEYVSGSRVGNRVTITARITPRYFEYEGRVYAKIGCLGQIAGFDQWPAASPAGSMRLLRGGKDITAGLLQFLVVPAGQVQPQDNATIYPRYGYVEQPVSHGANGVKFPANMGCVYTAAGRLSDLTGVFTFDVARNIVVKTLGSATFAAQSYIGVGPTGVLSLLQSQMSRRYGSRHDKFSLSVPTGTDYVLVNFPPTPIDPYDSEDPINFGLPGSGTYRLISDSGGLSVDHVNTMGITINGQWEDADNSGGDFLTHFRKNVRLAAPEYFLPPGVPYNSCMTNGGCPDSVLEQVYSATYDLAIYFLRVDRTADSGLTRIPLRQVGKTWNPGLLAAAAPRIDPDEAIVQMILRGQATPQETPRTAEDDGIVYLPIITNPRPPEPPPVDDPTGCPCGWFDANGRMFDYIPQP